MASFGVLLPAPLQIPSRKTSIGAIQPPTPPKSPQLSTPRTIAELVALRAKQHPEEPILGYPSSGLNYVEYTFSQLEAFSQTAANQYARKLPIRSSSDE